MLVISDFCSTVAPLELSCAARTTSSPVDQSFAENITRHAITEASGVMSTPNGTFSALAAYSK
jgi:hypothetical protein